MLQVRQPCSNLLLLQEAGEVHCRHHTSTTTGTLAAFAWSPGTQGVCFLPRVPGCSGTSPTDQHPRHGKSALCTLKQVSFILLSAEYIYYPQSTKITSIRGKKMIHWITETSCNYACSRSLTRAAWAWSCSLWRSAWV